jgi:hypothetical protein
MVAAWVAAILVTTTVTRGVWLRVTSPWYWVVAGVCTAVTVTLLLLGKRHAAFGEKMPNKKREYLPEWLRDPPLVWFVILLMALGVSAGCAIYFLVLDPHAPRGSDELASERMYTLIQGSVLILGVITAGGAAGIAYRAQRTKEAGYRLTWKANLHTRFESLAKMLADPDHMVRMAAAYGLEAVADEWAEVQDKAQRDVCVDLLCGYLRSKPTPTEHSLPETGCEQVQTLDRLEGEVRDTIIRIIDRHLHKDPKRPTWSDHDYDLHGAWLSSVFFAYGALFDGDVHFNEATFGGHTHLRGATFGGDAYFNGATFADFAHFDGATFIRGADFSAAAFEGDTSFDRAAFDGDAHFSRVTFGGNTFLRGATFTSDAGFGEATFTREADFREARFTSKADFRGVTFTDDADFGEAAFTSDANFRGTMFAGYADFREAAFTSDANFRGTMFTGDANFRKVTFGGPQKFRKATFAGYADFREATSTSDANFIEATFSGDANFSHTTFAGKTNFRNAVFTMYANFSHTTFTGGTNYSQAIFARNANFSESTFDPNGNVLLEGTRFSHGTPPELVPLMQNVSASGAVGDEITAGEWTG